MSSLSRNTYHLFEEVGRFSLLDMVVAVVVVVVVVKIEAVVVERNEPQSNNCHGFFFEAKRGTQFSPNYL